MRNTTAKAKDAYIHARVDKQVKEKAQKVLGNVGMSTTDAINLLLHQIIFHKGLPFDVRMPNKDTRVAIKETRAGGGKLHTGRTKDIFQEILESDE